MTDLNKNFRVKQGLETPTISVDSTATLSKGIAVAQAAAIGGQPLDSQGKANIIYNDTASPTLVVSNYNTGTEGTIVVRSYGQNRTGGTSSTSPHAVINLSSARGTPATPLAPGSGQLIGAILATGYDGANWTSDYTTVSTDSEVVPGSSFFFAAEAWSNSLGAGSQTATNVGVGFAAQIQPRGIRMDGFTRQRFIQAGWAAAPSANGPSVLNLGLGNGNNTSPTLTLSDGSTQHFGYGRSDVYIPNGSMTLYGVPFNATGSFTGEISGTTLTVSTEPTAPLSVGQRIYSNSAGAWGSVMTGTIITALGSGTGGTGTYTVGLSQTVASSTLYHGPQNQTYNGPFQVITSARRSGASGSRNALKKGDNMAGLLFRGINANNSTSVGNDCGGVFMETLEDFTASAYGTRLYLNTINTGTTTPSRRLELTDKNHNHNSDSHNFRNAAASSTIATLTTGSTNISATDGTNTTNLGINSDSFVAEINDGSTTWNPIYGDLGTTRIQTINGKGIVIDDALDEVQFTGSLVYDRTYGSFVNTATITPAAADTDYILPIDTTTTASNVTLSNTGTITIAKAGVYNIQFSLQLANADNANEHTFNVWFRKNGTDFGNSNTQYTVIKNGYNVAALNLVEAFAANDTLEIVYAVSNTDITIAGQAAQASPYERPATPSVILTVVPVGA